LQPPAAKADASDSSSNESCVVQTESRELVAIPAVSETLLQQESAVEEQISPQIPNEVEERISNAVLYPPSPNETVHARSTAFAFLRWALFNWAFVALLVAGVSTALGYLVGFAIGKH
jgi:hypothetical protein